VPIGPVFVAEGGFPYHRKPLQTSPDTEEVRQHLLELLQAMEEMPKEQHAAGAYVDEMVVWQLSEFRERRALIELKRISSFSPEATAARFKRTRKTLIAKPMRLSRRSRIAQARTAQDENTWSAG